MLSPVGSARYFSPRAWVQFYWSGAAVVTVAHDAQWGNTVGVLPAVTRTGIGLFTVTWLAAVSDPRAVSHNLNLRSGWGNSTTLPYLVLVQRDPVNPNKALIKIIDPTTGNVTDPSVAVDVYVQ